MSGIILRPAFLAA